jgi:putative hemolysin
VYSKVTSNRFVATLLFVLWLLSSQGCDSNYVAVAPTTPPMVAEMVNPAAKKCVEAGYTQAVLYSQNGVPTGMLCVNKEKGKKCEAWAYFRGECQLDADGSITTPPDTPSQKIANPSSRKCIEDGYTLKTLVSSKGIPTGVELCVDESTGKKCEAWAYFHGECQFDKTSPKPPILPPHK